MAHVPAGAARGGDICTRDLTADACAHSPHAAVELRLRPPPPFCAQLYVKGEFVGGCDIVTTMHQGGELKELLADVPRPQLA